MSRPDPVLVTLEGPMGVQLGREILQVAEERGLLHYEGIPQIRDALTPPVASGDRLWYAVATAAEAVIDWLEADMEDWEEGLRTPDADALSRWDAAERLVVRVTQWLRDYDEHEQEEGSP